MNSKTRSKVKVENQMNSKIASPAKVIKMKYQTYGKINSPAEVEEIMNMMNKKHTPIRN
jgi:hypothetical protein